MMKWQEISEGVTNVIADYANTSGTTLVVYGGFSNWLDGQSILVTSVLGLLGIISGHMATRARNRANEIASERMAFDKGLAQKAEEKKFNTKEGQHNDTTQK